MNLMQLRYFNSVCTFGTVSSAAEYLHIAQPSLSNALKELEKEFGVVLFRRHHRGMVPTPEGEILLKISKDILERANQAENIMKDLGKERKKLKLGVPPMTGSIILPNIYRDFLAKNNDISLEIIECGRQEMQRKISEDYLDMAFLSHSQPLDPELSVIQIAQLEIVCCTTPKNIISKQESVTPSDLEKTPLVMFEDGFFQTAEIKKWFSKSEVKPNILLQTAQLSTMLSIISSKTAVGFVFKQLIENDPQYVSVSLEAPIYVNVSLVRKKDKYLSSSMKKFIDYTNNNNLFAH